MCLCFENDDEKDEEAVSGMLPDQRKREQRLPTARVLRSPDTPNRFTRTAAQGFGKPMNVQEDDEEDAYEDDTEIFGSSIQPNVFFPWVMSGFIRKK